eukprot:4432195-Prymnesium_polylepis.1
MSSASRGLNTNFINLVRCGRPLGLAVAQQRLQNNDLTAVARLSRLSFYDCTLWFSVSSSWHTAAVGPRVRRRPGRRGGVRSCGGTGASAQWVPVGCGGACKDPRHALRSRKCRAWLTGSSRGWTPQHVARLGSHQWKAHSSRGALLIDGFLVTLHHQREVSCVQPAVVCRIECTKLGDERPR